ncbi:ferritin [Halanaerobacter jeridensis]|uniref:Ferritin n=1 Tax=Halanaerobacter jeridensis TaxID=706427 RepID=A0A938XVF6_9FIRM|nr:ferritin [Halanaerobacter jeridensis]MBM7557569.1 ferritin [Halanaerobacter jeridensis]
MLSDKLEAALNEQMNFELLSAHYYLAMAGYCQEEDLDGFSHFFWVQAEEERFHAEKFYNFINEKGGRAKFGEISKPQNEFESLTEVFETALEHEKEVTRRIYELMDLAQEESEYATVSFLNWFVDEQVEEEDSMEAILNKLNRLSDNSNGLFMLDSELGQRTFTKPQDAEEV